MANFTIVVSNTLNFMGGKPAQQWGSAGAMVWGTSNWGMKGDFFEIVATHLLSESLTLNDPSLSFNVIKILDAETLSLDSTIQNAVERGIFETLDIGSDMSDLRLQDANGYYLVFTKPTENSDDRANTAYTSLSAGSASYTSQAGTTTTWSSL